MFHLVEWKVLKNLKNFNLDQINSKGYSFFMGTVVEIYNRKFSVKEIPIIFSDRTIGQSKMSRTIVYEAIFMVWRLRIWKIFKWHS